MKIENSFVRGFLSGFRNFGHNVTNVINFILLVPVYFIGVGITAILAKASGKKFLELDIKGKTYWKEKKQGKEPIKKYYRQF